MWRQCQGDDPLASPFLVADVPPNDGVIWRCKNWLLTFLRNWLTMALVFESKVVIEVEDGSASRSMGRMSRIAPANQIN
jgi:hypothetical protein